MNNEKSCHITLHLNARFQPVHRFELEDALEELLTKTGLGYTDGGGTAQFPSGEVASCDIEIILKDDSEGSIKELERMIEALGVAKGSKLQLFDGKGSIQGERPVGRLEGMAVYLNGTELPEEVYQSCDINYFIEQANSLMDGSGNLYSWWEGPQNTALYFYGESYEKMSAAISELIKTYPLCQKCVIEKIA